MSILQQMVALLPDTAGANDEGHLTIGGCDAVGLAAEFGTPLYVFDEATLRATCAGFRREFARTYGDSSVIYAAKAFLCRALAAIINEEGLGLDAVSGGEMSVARSIGFPADRV
jgi:diaminopimelate decarboxylase